MKTFNLKVGDRFGLLEVIPRTGSYIQMQIAKRLQGILNLSVEEIEKLNFVAEQTDAGTRVRFDSEADQGVDFEFSDLEIAEITKQLGEREKKSQLTPSMTRPYEIFCLGGDK